jgi:hypothetical protein
MYTDGGHRGSSPGDRPFGIQPGQRITMASELGRHLAAGQRPQMIVGCIRRAEVVAQEPVAGQLPLIHDSVGVGELAGIQVQQVVHPPPARRGTGSFDQMRLGKLTDRLPRLTRWPARQRRHQGS